MQKYMLFILMLSTSFVFAADVSVPVDLTEKSAFSGTLSQGELQKFGDYLDRQHMLMSKDPEKAHREAIERVSKEINSIKLNCELQDAAAAGSSKSKATGETIEMFEAACTNGMGYMLIAQQQKATAAISCFSANAIRADDQSKGVASDFYCQLPANSDSQVAANKLLKIASINCEPTKIQWFGQSTAKQVEYTEVACKDGKGYLLRTALAGSIEAPSALNCEEASKQGLTCKLTKANIVTMEILIDALAKQGMTCQGSNLRVIGQENLRKRFVVEGRCPEQPTGFIAYIPLDGITAPFETMDCNTAKSKGITCTLNAK